MAGAARRSDPELWEKIKREVKRGDKGGAPGQWSARKAQFAVARYKKAGGGYLGPKASDNSLAKWTREDWDTMSGRPSRESGEPYFSKRTRDRLARMPLSDLRRRAAAKKVAGRSRMTKPALIEAMS